MKSKTSVRTRRDRWADWAVIVVLVVALLLGWAVKTVAEGQRVTYTNAEAGLTVRYPQGWLLRTDPKLAFHALDPGAGAFRTTYQVRVSPIDATVPLTSTLNMALNDASLARAQGKTAYRLFDIHAGPDVGGRPTMEATYAYVVEGTDLFVQQMPVVVEGIDIALVKGDRVYVFSLSAAEDAFAGAEKAFRRFVETATFQ